MVVDFGFFTISPAEYRAAEEAVVAVTLGWAVVVEEESLLEQPIMRTPANRSTSKRDNIPDDLSILNITVMFLKK